MFQFLYHLMWGLLLLIAGPFHLLSLLWRPKYRASTLPRLGIQPLPEFTKEANVLWLHAVSLGETQIAVGLAEQIRKKDPDYKIVISTCTETGQLVAKQSPHVDASFYYPVDTWPHISLIFNKINPAKIIVVETDLWANMLALAKRKGVPVYLVNAKISENSFKNYQRFKFIGERLLEPLTFLYVQCVTYDERFSNLGVRDDKKVVNGNLKLDRRYPLSDDGKLIDFWQSLKLDQESPLIVFGSTHAGEEQLLISVMKKLLNKNASIQFAFVPRHPERFSDVAALLESNGIKFSYLSKNNQSTESSGSEKHSPEKHRCLLVDKMGVLMSLYEVSLIGVVCGSFEPSVGGHNIFEPAFFAKPVIYGPWAYKQPGFHELMQENDAAIQIPEGNIEKDLQAAIEQLLADKVYCKQLGQRSRKIIEASQGLNKDLIDKVIFS